MKERPIPFNAEMVRAVLDGRKTQTRRVIKPQPTGEVAQYKFGSWDYVGREWVGGKCPYGKKGDRLWVRETFCIGSIEEEEVTDNMHTGQLYISQCKGDTNAIPRQYVIDNNISDEDVIWKPSIFMRREYSRINLEITDIRVERVQDISDQEAKAEGVDGIPDPTILGTNYHHIIPFLELWDSINFKRGFGWDVNPWVWVVEFRLLKSC